MWSFGTERGLRQHERHSANRINDLVENENNHANLNQNVIIEEVLPVAGQVVNVLENVRVEAVWVLCRLMMSRRP